MTQYAIVDPTIRTITIADVPDYKDAVTHAGLKVGETDFGIIFSAPDGSGISIIVYEWSLMDSTPDAYWSIKTQLCNGPAVLFRYNSEGETIDFDTSLARHLTSDCHHLLWLGTQEAAEAAISEGKVRRPETRINGELVWSWPAPRPLDSLYYQ